MISPVATALRRVPFFAVLFGHALFVLVMLGGAACRAPSPSAAAVIPPADSARAWVARAVDMIGGEAALSDLQQMRVDGIGHEYWMGVAERPSGPWPTIYQQFTELRDAEHERLRRTTSARWEQIPRWTTSTLILSDSAAASVRGGQASPGWPAQVASSREEWSMMPERVLPAALAATDLRAAPDTVLQGIPHHRVRFSNGPAAAEMVFNAYTGLPTAVVHRRAYPDDMQRNAFGTSTTRILLGTWELLPNGALYPHKYNMSFDGFEWRDYSLLRIDLDEPAPADSFSIPDQVRTAYHQNTQRPFLAREVGEAGPPVEIRDGIVGVRDFWHSTLIRQEDGVIVLESHLTPGYANKLMAEAERRFPGQPIKALVLTSDPWTHLGGVRAFAERGVPIYVVDASVPFFERLLAGVDGLDLQPVRGHTTLGTGANRVELFPLRGEYSERMLMAYFPEHRLLYGTDLLWQDRANGGYVATQAWELARAVGREHLAVDSVFHVHSAQPVAWGDVVGSIPATRRAGIE